MPRFLIDENLSPLIAQALRSFGYDAKAVRELGLTGYSDQDIVQSATNNGRIIVTGDIEFGELFYRHYGQISMIVLKNKPADTIGGGIRLFLNIRNRHSDRAVLREWRNLVGNRRDPSRPGRARGDGEYYVFPLPI